jgi:hypothetical protein
MWNCCLACQEELFVNNLVHVKDDDEHALDFALPCLAYFGLGEFELSVYGSCFLPRTLV